MRPSVVAQSSEASVKPNADTKAPSVMKAHYKYKNLFIDAELCDAVKGQTESINEQLKDMTQGYFKLGQLLAELKARFETFQVARKLDSEIAEDAFSEYVQVTFDIRISRANEYIRVAQHEQAQALKLPISKLVELSRLSGKTFKEFLKKHPEAALGTMTYREIKRLVKKDNEKSRVVVKKGKSEKAKPEAKGSAPSNVSQMAERTRGTAPNTIENGFVGSVDNIHDIASGKFMAADADTIKIFKDSVKIVIAQFDATVLPEEIVAEIEKIYSWKNSKVSKKVQGL